MAAGGQDLEEVLKTYIDRGATDGMLKLTPIVKCFDAAKLTKYKSTLESSVWAKHQNVAKKCTVKQVATVIIDDTAAFFVGKKQSLKGKAPMDDAEVVAVANEIRTNITGLKDAKKATGPKMDAATKRLTDTSKYTGAHKERFGADGQGKGIAGRADVADGSGYVGNYKGEGTYDKK